MKPQIILISFISLFNTLFAQTGFVVDVIDGDTVTIKSNEYSTQKDYDIFFIDAPESKQDYGMISKQHLVSLLMNKPISYVVLTKPNWNKDFGKRKNGKVIIYYNNGENLSEHMVANGYAWFDRKAAANKDEKKKFSKLEKKAKRKKLGLWEGRNIISPEEFVLLENEREKKFFTGIE